MGNRRWWVFLIAVTTLALSTLGARAARADDMLDQVKGDQPVQVVASLGHPVLLAGRPAVTFLKVGLTGERKSAAYRTPANLSIVLDRSSSMEGERIAKAREAAVMLVDNLRPEDFVSVVVYSDTVEVLVPATLAADRAAITRQIRAIQSNGSTALFAGVSKGAQEVRKHLDRNRTNRVVLLS